MQALLETYQEEKTLEVYLSVLDGLDEKRQLL